MKIFVSAAVLAAALPLSCAAVPVDFDKLLAPAQAIFQASGAVSTVVVVVTPEASESFAFGMAAPGSRKRADDESLLRINSTSKLLAAHVALQMATEGKVALDAPYGPSAPMTPRQLITHTSGMPRDPDLPYPDKAPALTWPTQEVRSTWLASQKLAAPAGTAALYSNIGYDLLADALARAAGKP